MDIGSKGLAEVNLTIPQETSLAFDVVHKDEDGHVVDHSASTLHMAIQSKDGETTYQLDGCCSATAERIRVAIPAASTAALPLGKMVWDLIAETTAGDVIRLCYGAAQIVDTYALDGE